MRRGPARAGALALALATLAACGVKALPRPPLGRAPAAAPASPAPGTAGAPPQECPACAAPEGAPAPEK